MVTDEHVLGFDVSVDDIVLMDYHRKGGTEVDGFDHLGKIALDLTVPLSILYCNLIVEDVEEGALGAVLEHNEDSLLLLRVYCLTEEDDVGVAQSKQKIDLRVNHFNQLLLLQKILLFYFVEPEDLHCLHYP